MNTLLDGLVWMLALVALIPLGAVLGMVVVQGVPRLTWIALSSLPPGPLDTGGGFGNALLGTILMVGLASLISVPVGILSATFLAEIQPDSWLARTARSVAQVMTGFPSILAGVFAYGIVVLWMGRFSAIAGGMALSLLMLPTIVLTAEEALRMVPGRMREAAIGMGATRTQVIWSVVYPTALPALLTGVMLAVARAAGETAPLLFTALFSNYWSEGISHRTASLSVLIYQFSGSPADNQKELAWTAALVLVLLVLFLNLTGRSLYRKPQ